MGRCSMRPAESVSAPSLIPQLHAVSGEIRMEACLSALVKISENRLLVTARCEPSGFSDAVQSRAGCVSRHPVPRPGPDTGHDGRTAASPRADVGVFGGSGFYEFLPDAIEVAVTTASGVRRRRR